MEFLLNIHFILPKQVAIINSLPNNASMEEDEEPVITAGIDTSESTVVAQKYEIENLKEENYYLKKNLQNNVNKLNEALKAVDMMQNMLIIAGYIHESCKIYIDMLDKSLDYFNHQQDNFTINTNDH